jgi:hypothetical protein
VRRVAPIAAGSLLILWCLPAALAQGPANEDCLACHGDESSVREDGRSIAVRQDTFDASVHGAAGVACVTCHTDLADTTEFPHPERLARVDCSTCHDDPAAKHAAGVHAAQTSAGTPRATCAACHGAHDILPSKNPAARTYHLNVPALCITCHGAGGVAKTDRIAADFHDSIHAEGLLKRGLLVAPNCATCHGAHDVRAPEDPESRVHGSNVITTCTTCHGGILPAFERSVHARALERGHSKAPTCASCHTAHAIVRTETERWQLEVVSECGSCHTESLRTYRDTFHGKVTALGFSRVAKCADCHGAHGILPASNPESPISPERRLQTCQQCHPSATEKFAWYDPHGDAHDRERNPGLYYASLAMKGLLGSVFVFFGIHTMLWFPRSLQVRRERRRRERERQEPGAE